MVELVDVILRAIREKSPTLTREEAAKLILTTLRGMDPEEQKQTLLLVRGEIQKLVARADPDRCEHCGALPGQPHNTADHPLVPLEPSEVVRS